MSSSSGNSSGRSVDDGDERKRRRMESNRDSARRSRMRKQKHVDDLTDQINRLVKEKTQIVSSMSLTNQSYMAIEAQNSVLKAQKNELTQRLQSLNDILSFINATKNTGNGFVDDVQMMDPWSISMMNQMQPIMASSDVFFPYY